MMSSLYIGATGMKTHGSGLSVVSNNMSNVSTIGYKQQSVVFEDLFSQNLAIGATGSQGFNQMGLGASAGPTRTIFTEGSYEPGSSATDLAITGGGYFQVTSNEKTHYTRAGNFRFKPDGSLQDPSGFTLTGEKMENGVSTGTLEPIHIDFQNEGITSVHARMSSQLKAVLNIGSSSDLSTDATDPYFSLQQGWNGTMTPPLSGTAYTSAQPMTVYDSEGTQHELMLYLDGAPSLSNGKQVYEYVIGMNPEEDGSVAAGTEGAGLLMAGTLTFSASGQLEDMSAFVPGTGGGKDLASWTPASLVDGVPQFTARFAGVEGSLEEQPLTLDLGIQSQESVWTSVPASAAEVGLAEAGLPSLGTTTKGTVNSTAFDGTTSRLVSYNQDGVGEGSLVDISVTENGLVQAQYSNSETVDLYRIPLFRFTSEDGLERAGSNHYVATEDVGQIEYGEAGTENWGAIVAEQLETSNVDMSREMVNMIVIQRGFQMNSKSVVTADSMLQKAIELKRN